MKSLYRFICVIALIFTFLFSSACALKANEQVLPSKHSTFEQKENEIIEQQNSNSSDSSQTDDTTNVQEDDTNNEQNNTQTSEEESTSDSENTEQTSEDEDSDLSDDIQNNIEYELSVVIENNEQLYENCSDFWGEKIATSCRIKLLKDVEVESFVVENSNVQLDLNRHSLKISDKKNIEIREGVLTIVSSTDYGKIESSLVTVNGDLIISGGIVVFDYDIVDGTISVNGGYYGEDVYENYIPYLASGYCFEVAPYNLDNKVFYKVTQII